MRSIPTCVWRTRLAEPEPGNNTGSARVLADGARMADGRPGRGVTYGWPLVRLHGQPEAPDSAAAPASPGGGGGRGVEG